MRGKILDSCPVCGAPKRGIETLMHLPDYPLTERIGEPNRIPNPKEVVSDQELLHCPVCEHVFLGFQIDPDDLYGKDYLTVSATSQAAVSASDRLLTFASRSVSFSDLGQVFDIGANDGTLLQQIDNHGFKGSKFALDPSFSEWGRGITGFTGFLEDFDFKMIPRDEAGTLFISSHVLEHVANPVDFLGLVSEGMGPNDTFVLQFPAIEPLLYDRRFDQVHHQHFHYFSWNSLQRALGKTGLELIDAQIDWSHYGAGNVALRKKDPGTARDFHERVPPWNDIQLGKVATINRTFAKTAIESFMRFRDGLCEDFSSREIVALGAGLMAPIVFYHYRPLWNNFTQLLDGDPAKEGLRYANTPHAISTNLESIRGNDVMVTGSVSKLAGRRLFEVAASMDARTITLPVHFP